MLVMGDMNIDYLRWETFNEIHRELIDMIDTRMIENKNPHQKNNNNGRNYTVYNFESYEMCDLKWKTTSPKMEDDQKPKTTKNKDDQKRRRPKMKTTKNKDDKK